VRLVAVKTGRKRPGSGIEVLVVLLCSCAVGPDFVRPEAPTTPGYTAEATPALMAPRARRSGATGTAWTLAAQLAAPVFHGGTLRAEHRGAIDAYQASLASYRETTLTGFQQVADTLWALAYDADLIGAQQRLLDTASESLLEALAAELRAQHGVEASPLAIDLTAPDLDARVEATTRGLEIGLLVYNAGAVHAARKLHDQPVSHALGLMALNCTGPLLLTRALRAPARRGAR